MARDGWAVENGVTTGTSGIYVDQVKLIDALGIPWSGSLTTAMAVAEAKAPDPEEFRRPCLLQPYGPHRDTFPQGC